MVMDIFETVSSFILRLNESLAANLITSSMLETYALVALQMFNIVNLAARYARFGNRLSLKSPLNVAEYYWRSMFDPHDELSKLAAGFNQYAVHEIASQVSQISLLLEQHHQETSIAIEDIAREVRSLRLETKENNRLASNLFAKIVTGMQPIYFSLRKLP